MNIAPSIFSALNAIAAVSLGVLVLLRNPKSRVNIGFTLGMATLSMVEAGGLLLLLSGSTGLEAAGAKLYMAGQALLPAGWLLFSVNFGRNRSRDADSRWWPVLAVFSAAGVYFAYLANSPELGAIMPGLQGLGKQGILSSEAPLYNLGKSGVFLHIFLILGLLVNLIHLENTLRASKGEQRDRIKYAVFAVGGLLAFFIYNSAEALLFRMVEVRMVPLTTAVVSLSLVLVSVFIVRHRLMDTNVYVSRYVVYNSVTVLITGAYLVATGAIAHGISLYRIPFSFFLTGLFVFIAALGLVAILFNEMLKRKTENFISRHFYRHKYDFKRRWMETIDKLGSRSEIDEIIFTLSGIISRTSGSSKVNVWLYDRVARVYRLEAGAYAAAHEKICKDHGIIKALSVYARPFIPGQPAPGAVDLFLEEDAKKLLDSYGASICAPIEVKGDNIGFILIGPDMCRSPYCQDDLDLVRAVASQAGLQIKSVWLAEDVAAAKEAELFHNMSSFIIHDLKNLTNSLSLLSRNADANMEKPEFRKDAIKAIRNTVSKMKSLIDRLSDKQSSGDLRKALSDMNTALEKAVNQVNIAGVERPVIISESAPLPPIIMDSEAMEAVLLNLLSNACEAAGTNGKVTVRSYRSAGFACISVIDSGPGIPKRFLETSLFKPFRSTKKKGLGIGLFHCKSVVEAHGGVIEVDTRVGLGATFTVKLPLHTDSIAV